MVLFPQLMSVQEKLSHYMSLLEQIQEEVEENGEDDNEVINVSSYCR